MQQDHRNLISAIILSVTILLVWNIYIAPPPPVDIDQRAPAPAQSTTLSPLSPLSPMPQVDIAAVPSAETTLSPPDRRVDLQTPQFNGSINLTGGRIDDLKLRHYHETTNPESPEIVVLSPERSNLPSTPQSSTPLTPQSESKQSGPGYFATFGWSGDTTAIATPDDKTPWNLEKGDRLTPQTPITLRWDNDAGLIFRRTIKVDDAYMFTIVQQVENTTTQPVQLNPYGLVRRYGTPEISGFFILHEGLIGYSSAQGLQEIDYDGLYDDGPLRFRDHDGWLGITDKYWAAALIPPSGQQRLTRFQASDTATPIYQVDYLIDSVTIPANSRTAIESRLFAGAKVVSTIETYEKRDGILKFDLLIDWGWFYFITRYLFLLIDYFYGITGNFGVAILIVTVLIKIAFFPLANKSYVAMSKMKLLQPEMATIRERCGDDKAAMQKEMMRLYKEKKINPAAGCLPIIIQIPVFFALYKVLFVTIEMRHAPFFGWIHDLAAPDPTSIFNLFGLLPWTPPALLIIGLWPCIMGVTMFVQMQMNPAPPDPLQAKIFAWMPLFFTMLLASFPSGLVIYWTWNNLLSIAQQWLIMTRQGVKIELFDNLRTMLARRRRPPDGDKTDPPRHDESAP